MSPKKAVLVAAIAGLAVVVIARALQPRFELAVLALLPGAFIDLAVYGVHQSWEGPLGQVLLIVPSAVAWFILFLAGFLAYEALPKIKE